MALLPASYREECKATVGGCLKGSFSAVLSRPLKRRPVNLAFFIPLPAGLAEIKQREYGPRCRGAGIFHAGVRVDKPHLSGLRWTGACSDQ